MLQRSFVCSQVPLGDDVDANPAWEIMDNHLEQKAVLTNNKYTRVELWDLFKENEWFNYQGRTLERAKDEADKQLSLKALQDACAAGLPTGPKRPLPSPTKSVGSGSSTPGYLKTKRLRSLPGRPLPPSGNGASASSSRA